MCVKRSIGFILTALLCAACGGGGGGSSSADEPSSTSTSAVTSAGPPPPATPPQPPQQSPPPPPTTHIDVLALYTQGVADRFAEPELRINHLVNVANDVLAQNAVALTLVISRTERVDYPDDFGMVQALDDVTFARHIAFDPVGEWRDAANADLVVLLRPYANDGYCGYAWIGGHGTQGDFSNPAEADFGYSVVGANCSDYSLLHEIGHNLGLAHSRREDPQGGTFAYAVGHGVDNDFATIMASPNEFNAARLPRLASPDLVCNGQPCGVVHTAPDGADAVRTLNLTKSKVAGYR